MDNYLSIEFRLEREKRYLQQNPCRAITLALNYLEDFLNLVREFRALEKKYQSVMADNQLLTSQLIKMLEPKAVRLPAFLKCSRH